jgi:hypothetical protein
MKKKDESSKDHIDGYELLRQIQEKREKELNSLEPLLLSSKEDLLRTRKALFFSYYKLHPAECILTNIAMELAQEGASRLMVPLQEMFPGIDLPEELFFLLRRFLYIEMFKYLTTMKAMMNDPELSALFQGEEWAWWPVPGEDGPLLRRVYDSFRQQLEQYKKTHRENIVDTILKAKEGNVRAICKLLEWDKVFLEFPFINRWISSRGLLYDAPNDVRRLEMSGGAIGKKPKSKNRADRPMLFSLVEFFASMFDLSGNNNRELKALHFFLSRKTEILDLEVDDAEYGSPLHDYRYFVRYLKRHNIL